MEQYAYQDFSLKNRKRERWKAISGFEDYYEISSHGRIKSLERTWNLPNGGIRVKPEHIISQRVTRNYNKRLMDNSYGLVVALYLDSVTYCFSVARLVYDKFVTPIDLEDRSILINFKDSDSRNLNFKNLEALTLSETRKRQYITGRAISDKRKIICQFDSNGKFVAQYTSISEAGHKNGFDVSTISSVVRKGGLYKGYLWQEGISKKLKRHLPKGIDQGLNPNFTVAIRNKSLKELPAVNLSLKSIIGERWKDFPGYEGLYQISNKGRIKALGRVSEGKLKKWLPERIMMLCQKIRRPSQEDSACVLTATLSKNGMKKGFIIARYVHYLFVRKFDLLDRSARIFYKDGNAHNLDRRNLYLPDSIL
jgi:hypothetical protein